jgi:hypothetical protein
MAEVIQGVFPGSEGLDGALPGVSSVAALNLSPKPGDPEYNLLLAEGEIRTALVIEPSLRYVVLPELFTCAYSALESVYLCAEDAEGERAPGSSPPLPGNSGYTSPMASPKESPGPPSASSTARTSLGPRAWFPPTASATWWGRPLSSSSLRRGPRPG